jgi:c-di-GMP-binding flagellar brake protein YcgR
MSSDRRDTFRVRPASSESIPVEIVASGSLELGQLMDISEGGAAVRLEAAAADLAGKELELLIGFPGTHGIYVKGIVRRVRMEANPILGVQFINLPAKALDAIRGYISGRGQRHSGRFKLSG